MQHLARLFLNAHAAQQIGRAQFGGQAPVFVRGQFAVAIKIAETQALDGDDRFAAAFNHRLFGDGPLGAADRAAMGTASARRDDIMRVLRSIRHSLLIVQT
jgi:hypothetical protein